MSERDDLTPYHQRAVTHAVARTFMALGIAAGGLWGRPISWWASAALLGYAVVALAWAAARDGDSR